MPQPPPRPSLARLGSAAVVAWGLAGAGLLVVSACSRPAPADRPTVAAATAQTSASCRACHEDIHRAWANTDHALANRPADDEATRAAFTAQREISDGGSRFSLAWTGGRPHLTEQREDGTAIEHRPEFILGAKPLWQPLVPAPGGRWQPTDLAFDVQRNEWFNVFGSENRRPGEWGHWTGRGMNWNSMCAPCHMTGYARNYDPATDSYASRWVEHGVGCIQCHGAMPAGHDQLHRTPGAAPRDHPQPPFRGDRTKMMQTCAPCHARNEPLTDRFQPGDNYHDHYRVTLPVDPATFHPDGQQRDEDFNWTSVLLSRMGAHGGVTCLDCHDPHTTKTILPKENNQLCLQCHAAPGRIQPNGVRAVPIDPLAHSHHRDGSPGNSCVACHMPTTNYMQRAPRHDHGWLIPDPLLNQELGIPDACSRCHQDKPASWSAAATERWYGEKMEGRQRRRTRALAAAQSAKPGWVDGLLSLWAAEDIPVWRATFLDLLAGEAADPRVANLAQAALGDADPVVRASAVRALGRSPAGAALITPLLQDPVRLVRLDAAWALSPSLPDDSPARLELDAYLKLGLDQPGGLLRLGQDLANRGRLAEAAATMARAIDFDPHSPGIRQAYGLVLAGLGRATEAANQLAHAANSLPRDAHAAAEAGLALAEAGDLAGAERYLRLAVARDPQLARAWYNLGLLLAQGERLTDATDALARAERADPRNADYPYALATVLLRTGQRDAAQAAIERTLRLDPAHPGARSLRSSR